MTSGLGCASRCSISGHGLTLATAGISAFVSVTILDSYDNSLPTSCHSAAMLFSHSQNRSFGSQALTCVETNTAVLAHFVTRSGQYGIAVQGLFSKFNPCHD